VNRLEDAVVSDAGHDARRDAARFYGTGGARIVDTAGCGGPAGVGRRCGGDGQRGRRERAIFDADVVVW
jgi:hypothetical protein